jgi:hypothetical protein
MDPEVQDTWSRTATVLRLRGLQVQPVTHDRSAAYLNDLAHLRNPRLFAEARSLFCTAPRQFSMLGVLEANAQIVSDPQL